MSEEEPDVEGGAAADGARQFVDEVLPAEREAIAARRRAAGVEGAPGLERPRGSAPTVAAGLVGLSLSGGGIRSAAFNLGVLQSLHRHGVLRHVDYLSTVSGGGWIGSALQTLLREPGEPFPFAPSGAGGGHEAPAVTHLRDRSAALLPAGLLGRFVLAAAIVRGQLATAVLLVPVMCLLAVATMPLVFAYIRVRAGSRPLAPTPGGGAAPVPWPDLPWTWFSAASRWVVLAVAAWMLAGFLYVVLERPPSARRRRLERAFGWSLAAAVGAVFLELQPAAAVRMHAYLFLSSDRSLHLDNFLSVGAALASALSLGPLAAALPRVARPLGLAVASLASVSLPYLAFLAAQAALVRLHLGHHRALDLVTAGAFAAGTAALLSLYDVNVMSLHAFYRDRLTRTFLLKRAGGGVEADEEALLSELNRAGSTAPYCLVNTAINLQASTDRSLRGRNSDLFVFSPRFVGSPRTGFCDTRVMEYAAPGLNLGTAMAVSAAAAAPNMGTYTVRAVVMLMTFLNLRLGYWLPHPARLAAWHRARGGAADLDAGGPARRWAWLRWAPRFPHYVRELFSLLREDGSHVFLSDGGHIENTGAFELLRRRCRLVVVSDAEEDPKLRFGGLAALLRYARIDLGVEIELDLAELRPRPDGASHRHAALGVIRYPATRELPAEEGALVYVKSSITGDEDELLQEYRARNPDFPHQSTSDQLYDEDQFEAYRALGQHAVDGLFTGGDGVTASAATLDAWVEKLAARLTPDASCDPAFAELRDELEEAEDLLHAHGGERYFRELYPELAPAGGAPEGRPEHEAAVVARQIHVMATAFDRLGLDVPRGWSLRRNRGWMSLFRRWAASPTFRRHWRVVVQQEGDAFRLFCEEALGLGAEAGGRDAADGAPPA